MEREFVAQKVANRLHEVEAALEEVAMKASLLLAEMYDAKAQLGMAATVGAAETERVGRAVASIQAAHGELVATHHGLAVIGRAAGMRTRAGGWKPNSASLAPAEQIAAA